ncbi:MAG: hypothetical protein QNK23_15500 [Crocinitomicaceae bacterium]|nr:hypothetical protein [Crocinitomicaceae bacterium]
MRKPSNYSEFVNSNKLRSEFDSGKGHTYDLRVYKDDFRFTLSIPPDGEVIEDDFGGLHRRKAFYLMLDHGEVFDWLCDVHQKILTEHLTKT